MTIVVLAQGMCGLAKCVTRYLVAMAVTDLLVIFIAVILKKTFELHLPYLPLFQTPVCRVHFVLRSIVLEASVCLTVAFTLDHFIAICCPKLKHIYCTERTAGLVIWTICVLLCLENFPFYFVYQMSIMINGQPWFCTVRPSCYTALGWRVFAFFDMIVNPLLPFILIVLFNSLTIRHVLVASRVRQRLRGTAKGRDEEMESRQKSIILLFTISGSFVLLWLTFMFTFIYAMVTAAKLLQSNYSSAFTIAEEVGYMLQSLSSCTNIVIYGVTQTQFRNRLKSILTYPITRLLGRSHNNV